MGVWDTTTPAGSDPKSQGDDRIREHKTAIQEALRGQAAEGTEAVFPGTSPSTAPVFRYRGLKGTTGARPAAGQYGLYYDTTKNKLSRDNGSTWDDIGKNPEIEAIHQVVAANLASVAGIVTLDETKNSFNVTGAEAVTAIQGWSAGLVIVKWVSSRVLTHSATFSLKDALSRTCAAGDISIFEFTAANTVREIAAIIASTQPTRQYLTSGAGATYTTPANCRKIIVKLQGGGGGGGAATANAGTAGNDTSFNSIVAKGGGAGGTVGGALGVDGTGGAGAASLRLPGNGGREYDVLADRYLAATTNKAGNSAPANSGRGGSGGTSLVSGAGSNLNTISAGYPGGGGEYAEFSILNPAATYTYTVGAAANGGAAGTAAGGNGGSGLIIVEEYY